VFAVKKVLSTSLLPSSENDGMKPAGQMTLTVTPELEKFVREEARRGAFASSSEYVRDMLRARYLAEKNRDERLKALDNALARGIADANAGRVIPLEQAFKRLRKELGLPELSAAE
jgi:antitoxin ParD1/3/4